MLNRSGQHADTASPEKEKKLSPGSEEAFPGPLWQPSHRGYLIEMGSYTYF